ncbi:hypothetical protein ACDZ28_32960 [Paenibacillus sp. RS8]|uniref:hypothetical protein n=1 Tax=Paenibacillus sp. RS8 TaxID=3242681 RepID=UPI0035C1F097
MSLRWKFSLLLAGLLLFTVSVLSVLVLRSIRHNQPYWTGARNGGDDEPRRIDGEDELLVRGTGQLEGIHEVSWHGSLQSIGAIQRTARPTVR